MYNENTMSAKEVSAKIKSYLKETTAQVKIDEIITGQKGGVMIYTQPQLKETISEAFNLLKEEGVTDEKVNYFILSIEDSMESGMLESSLGYVNLNVSETRPSEEPTNNTVVLAVFETMDDLVEREVKNKSNFLDKRGFFESLLRVPGNTSTCLLTEGETKLTPLRKVKGWGIHYRSNETALRALKTPEEVNEPVMEDATLPNKPLSQYDPLEIEKSLKLLKCFSSMNRNRKGDEMLKKTALMNQYGGDIYKLLPDLHLRNDVGVYIHLEDGTSVDVMGINGGVVVVSSIGGTNKIPNRHGLHFGIGEEWYPEYIKRYISQLTYGQFPRPLIDE